MSRPILPFAAFAVLVPLSPLAAQTAPEAIEQQATAPADPDDDEAIVVTGIRGSDDVLGNVSVLDRDELAHDIRPSLGDSLTDLPGVSASSFGPTASRPILRGESGERAPILVDGIGSLDLSSSDPDHAVTINPLTAQRIEVVRGPAALRYGSSAIAGVVNVIDSRIPRTVPTDAIAGEAFVTLGSAASERSGNLSLDARLGPHWVAHVDGSYSKYDDLHVGGLLLARPLRERALASPDPDIRALAALRDTLPNTAGRIDDVAGGLAYVDGDLNLGLSLAHHDARYGVPIRFSLDPAVEPEEPTIVASQDRGDLRANVPIGGFFSIAEIRGGLSKYHHNELEADGAVGSRFFSNGGEVRADLVQTDRAGWGGTSGVQYSSQDARIRGNEKYLPDSRRSSLGLFTVQSLVRGPLRFEGALRVDFGRLHAAKDAIIAEDGGPVGAAPITRRFTPLSGSLGANYTFSSGWTAGLSVSHSERAPSIDELFSNGPHGGSQQFLFGDVGLSKEASNGAELSLHLSTGPLLVQAGLYYSRFSNFIYEAPTGEIEERLPAYEFRQGKADYYGFDVEADARLGRAAGIDWGAELVSDTVRARIEGYGPAPEIPAFRILGGLTATRGKIAGRIEVERVAAQHRTAPIETPTPGYTMVNASLDWHPLAAKPALTVSLTGNNLFDVVARRSSSELKDYAPLAGRDIRLSARFGF